MELVYKAIKGLKFRQMVAMSINYGALFSDMVLRDFQPTCIFVHKVVRCHIMFSLKIHQRYTVDSRYLDIEGTL